METKLSDKIGFSKGNSTVEGIAEIKELVDNGEYAVGFAIHPLPFSDLVKISILNKNASKMYLHRTKTAYCIGNV